MSKWYRCTVSLLTALLLAALLCLTGILVTIGVERWDYDGQVEDMITRIKTRNSEILEMVGSRQTYQVANLYLTAIADATVRFEFFPRNDASHFLTLLRALPDEVQVDEFYFVGQALHITCSAVSEEELDRFAENIRSQETYTDVTCTTWLDGENRYQANIVCFSAEK